MRILHIIGTLDPKAGGPTESVRTLMTLGSVGYTGEVVTLDDPSAPFLRNYPFPVHPLGPSSLKYGYSSKLLPWIRDNHHRFDGVVINGLWQYCGLAALIGLWKRKPYMVFTHGMLDPYFKRAYPLKHIKKAIYWYLVEFWVLRCAFRVLFTTRQEEILAAQSFAFHSWRPQVVPYGSSGPQVAKQICLESFFDAVPQIRGKRFLLYLGRIHQKKGCDLLIQSFIKNAHTDPDLHMLMVGPDQVGWGKELKAQAENEGLGDRVHWPGMITGDAKWGAFHACEAFILPSHQENFGIAVAEALACGAPVLLSDQVNIAPEIAADGCGYVESDTAEGTEKLLQRWIATPSAQRDLMRATAAEAFRTRYDMKENAKMIMRLFDVAKGLHPDHLD